MEKDLAEKNPPCPSAPALMREFSITPKKDKGQNFLKDPSTARMIVSRAQIGPDERVLEIGPGLGALTFLLAGAAKSVVAVEWDRKLAEVLSRQLELSGLTNARIIREDVLNVDFGEIAALSGGPLTVVSNLPYCLSSPILVKIVEARKSVTRAILMFQKELADRITSLPGSREYGRISVLAQYAATIKTIASIGRDQFIPRPAVDSVVVEISFNPSPAYPAKSEELFFEVVKAAFGQRRKTLKNSLAGSSLGLSSGDIETALKNAGIDPSRRAETLSLAEFAALSDSVGEIEGLVGDKENGS